MQDPSKIDWPASDRDSRRKSRAAMKASWWSAGLALAVCGSAQAQSNAELKAMLEQALKTIQDLQSRVEALEQRRPRPLRRPAAPAPAPRAPAPPVVAPGAKPDAGVTEAARARVEVYGQVMLDAIYDFKRMDPEWNATLRPSKIPSSARATPGCGKDGATIFSVRSRTSASGRSFRRRWARSGPT